MVRAAALAIAIVGLLEASPARAAERIQLTYDAPPDCPSKADVLAWVALDGGRLEPAGPAEAAPRWDVSIAQGADGFAGMLAAGEASGGRAVRTIRGESCEAVARALALLVAIAIEAGPSGEKRRTAGLTEDAPAPEPDSALTDSPPPPVGDIVRKPRWRLAASISGSLSTETAPDLVPGLVAYAEIGRETSSWLSPWVRLGVGWSANKVSGQVSPGALVVFGGGGFISAPIPEAAEASLWRMVGRVDLCPVRLVLTQTSADYALTLQTCARAEIGELHSTVSTTFNPSIDNAVAQPSTEISRLWLSAGVPLRLRWQTPGFFFDTEVGAMFPLNRPTFFAESTPVFTIPAAAVTMGLGGGVFLF